MRISSLLLFCLATSSAVSIADETPAPLEQQAQQLAHQFVGQLKPQLKKAMEEGGPVQAIEICASIAPAIADALSADSGWQVKRVSLKARNPGRAIPDEWEQSVLKEFDQRALAGELPADINFGETKGDYYRYMQAQGVEPLCLVCHGTALSAPVVEILEEYYPDDVATGYSPGQVRGAISLARSLTCDKTNIDPVCMQSGSRDAQPAF